jgi:hypothetical protein
MALGVQALASVKRARALFSESPELVPVGQDAVSAAHMTAAAGHRAAELLGDAIVQLAGFVDRQVSVLSYAGQLRGRGTPGARGAGVGGSVREALCDAGDEGAEITVQRDDPEVRRRVYTCLRAATRWKRAAIGDGTRCR